MGHFAQRLMAAVIVSTNFALPVACAEVPSERAPSALVLFPKGQDVQYQQKDGAWRVHYSVKAKHPAAGLLAFISENLNQQGWEPLREDIFNPGLESSHARGWQEFLDARTSPKTKVHQWLAQWKNRNGDVVWYRLQYRSQKEMSEMPDTVDVVGIYYPASVVEQQLRWIDQDKKDTKTH
jgi:hypothetical protein